MEPFKNHLALLLCGSLCLSGCKSVEKGEFRIGIYSVSKTELKDVAAEGFDLVVGPASKDYLREANKYGIDVLAKAGDLKRLGALDQGKISILERMPSFWGWHLADEPDLHKTPPFAVQMANSALKRWARKPTALVLSSGMAVESYSECADYFLVDWYPVPWAPVATFSRQMIYARLGARGKPFYAILQAFSWGAFPELIDTDVALRAPTYEELRCMAFLAMCNGARGILFYSYSQERWKLKDHPLLWTAVESLIPELRQFSPLFTRPLEGSIPKAHDLEKKLNEVNDDRISLFFFELLSDSPGLTQGLYIVAINTTTETVEASFVPPNRAAPALKNISQPEEEIKRLQDKVVKRFEPFEVAIFH
jgi:hypothetical protein